MATNPVAFAHRCAALSCLSPPEDAVHVLDSVLCALAARLVADAASPYRTVAAGVLLDAVTRWGRSEALAVWLRSVATGHDPELPEEVAAWRAQATQRVLLFLHVDPRGTH